MTEFKLPELGENVHQGDLVRLMVAPGATVAEGQPVMELETDKAVVEVPSSISGTVKDVLVKQGEKLNVGQVIFTIENGKIEHFDVEPKPRRRRRHLQHLGRKHQLQPHSPQRRLLHEPEQFQQSRRKPPRSQSSSFLSWVKTFTRATWFVSWSHRALVSLRVNR